MADDQVTLGTFTAERDGEGDPDTDPDAGSGDGDAGPDAEAGDGALDPDTTATSDGSAAALDGDPVCPWCLAPATAFVERGLTGRACGRCSAVLPVDADWFQARDVVARRPMYEVEE